MKLFPMDPSKNKVPAQFFIPAHETNIIQLVNLGFSRKDAINALQAYPNDVERAAEYLLTSCQPASEKNLVKSPPKHSLIIKRPASFSKLFTDKKTCDVTFIVGPDKTQILAHKFILANCSEVFSQMFFSEQKLAEGNLNSVDLLEYTPEHFNSFLEFCYIGTVSNQEITAILSLFTLAEKYMVKGFKEYLTDRIHEMVSEKNAISMLALTKEPIFKELREVVENGICKEAMRIFSVNDLFKELSIENITEILKLPLECTEYLILERIIEYIMSRLDKDVPRKEIREKFKDLLGLVNLKNLGTHGISLAFSSGLYKKSELLKIMLTNPEIKKSFTENMRNLPK